MSSNPSRRGTRAAPRPPARLSTSLVSWAQSLAVFCFGTSILLEIGQSQWHWPLLWHGWPSLVLDCTGALLMAGSLVLLWAARRR